MCGKTNQFEKRRRKKIKKIKERTMSADVRRCPPVSAAPGTLVRLVRGGLVRERTVIGTA